MINRKQETNQKKLDEKKNSFWNGQVKKKSHPSESVTARSADLKIEITREMKRLVTKRATEQFGHFKHL